MLMTKMLHSFEAILFKVGVIFRGNPVYSGVFPLYEYAVNYIS